MKLWFEFCHNITLGDPDSIPVLLGFNCYRHSCGNPKYFKPWRGWSVYLHFFKWTLVFNIVDDHDAYDRKINYWRYPRPKRDYKKSFYATREDDQK